MQDVPREVRIVVTSAQFVDDTIEVEVQNGQGGTVELWEQGSLMMSESKSIPASGEVVFNAQSYDNTDCYYVIATEPFPSPDFDMVDVEGGGPCGEVEIEPLPLSAESGGNQLIAIKLNLRDEGVNVKMWVFGKKDNAHYFHRNKFQLKNPATGAQGRHTEVVQLDEGDAKAAVLITYKERGQSFKRMARL